jgi:mutator protein MutT
VSPRRGGDQLIPRPTDWMPAGPPPWHGHHHSLWDLDTLIGYVAQRGSGIPMGNGLDQPRPSAVLVALFDDGDGPEVVLTRRNKNLRNHQGEVSFPGGRLDVGEAPAQAAVREAFEEVALDPREVQVVGELDHIATFVSNSLIVPVVARLDGRPQLEAHAAEVARVFTVSLRELLTPGVYSGEIWRHERDDVPVSFFALEGETVWGATARLLVQLLAIATGVAS